MTDERTTAQNTDREIWREVEGDPMSPSIHVTARGSIGINVGGRVYVMDIDEWHMLAMRRYNPEAMTERRAPLSSVSTSPQATAGAVAEDKGEEENGYPSFSEGGMPLG